jgi:hypothetical protein
MLFKSFFLLFVTLEAIKPFASLISECQLFITAFCSRGTSPLPAALKQWMSFPFFGLYVFLYRLNSSSITFVVTIISTIHFVLQIALSKSSELKCLSIGGK